jgi:hypothetical protein
LYDRDIERLIRTAGCLPETIHDPELQHINGAVKTFVSRGTMDEDVYVGGGLVG